jgi:adenine deaminase
MRDEMDKKRLEKLILVAGKKEKADIVIRNGKIINVFTGEINEGDIAIVEGFFAGIGSYEGLEEIDARGRYVSPTFIDGHVHIESSLTVPSEFAKVLLPHGVTSVIADPHEIANVSGVNGIQFMLDASRNLPFDFFFMLPSCVPATSYEQAGAILENEELSHFYEHPKVIGLAEVMNAPAVRNADENMLNKLLTAINNKAKIDGHAAGLREEDINIYMSANIRTDHECVTAEEAKIRLDRGMYVMLREGTVAKNLQELIKVVTQNNARRCLFVTDDKHLDDLVNEGSIDHNVRKAIKYGLPPINAIQMASLNTAECFGLTNKGAIAPGYEADFMLLENLEEVDITHVFKSGKLVAEFGKLRESVFKPEVAMSKQITNSVKLPQLTANDFKIQLTSRSAHIIEIIPNSLVTNHLIENVDIIDDIFQPSIEKDQLTLAVVERHHLTGAIGLGIVKGLRLKEGAIATTIAHDSHNLIIAGTNSEDMLTAARAIEKMHGGLVVVKNGEVIASLSLPIAGLMSEKSYQEVLGELNSIHEALLKIGASKDFNAFLTLSFLALPVIPKIKLTDQGLFNVETFSHIDINAYD